MKTTAAHIEQCASLIRRLCERIDETFALAPHGPEHHAACAEFHRQFDELAFPGGLKRGLARLGEDDPDAVAAAILFLEADPMFFRSGYIKETILRRLKHVSLTARQTEALARLVVRSLDRGGRREFHGYARLAGAFDSPVVRQAATERLESKDPEVARRAAEVLHVLKSQGKGRA